MKGKTYLVRYADDAVIGCENREDEERIMQVLAARFEKYGLKLHPEKTRLLDFTKPVAGQRKGKWIVGRKTAKTRLSRALAAINTWCRANRHKPIREQWETLKAKLIVHYAYYGISLNFRSIAEYYDRVRMLWRSWLNSRSRKASMNWKSYLNYLKEFPLPKPRIVHSYCSAKL
jgi:hypothetical protein